jgi:UDP-glucose 4-epimerase
VSSARDWSGARALVTGATGFIGSHLVRCLASLGAQVHAVSRRPPGSAGNAPHTAGPPHAADDRLTWHLADLRDTGATAALLGATRPDVVFHLASEVTGARDVKLVLPLLQANLTAAVNLMAAAADTGCSRVVLAGSIEEPRTADPTPSSPYAVAKWAATGYARMFHALWKVPVTVLRVAMVYGPAQPDTTKLVPYATLSLLRGDAPALSSGLRLIDWVYVDDVVDAFALAATAERAAGHAIDIGSGTAVSIRDTIDLLAEVAGSPLRPHYGAIADRPLDAAMIADTSLAADLLGWRPATELKDGLRHTVEWYRRSLTIPAYTP